MQSNAKTVKEYLAALPEERRKAIGAVRKVIRANIDKSFVEGIQYGMIGYFVPHSLYPAGYHCDPKQPLPFASLAAQKNHMALYTFCLYFEADRAERFRKAWKATGKKLDMGKSCVRFKKLEDVPLDVVADLFSQMTAREYIAQYEAGLASTGTKRKPAAKKKPARKTSAKKATRKPAAKKATRKAAAKKTTRKAAAKKTTRKAAAKKATRKAAAKKATRKTAPKKTVRRGAAKKARR